MCAELSVSTACVPSDDSPSPPAPFEHRIVSVKQGEVTSSYSVCRHQLLGG